MIKLKKLLAEKAFLDIVKKANKDKEDWVELSKQPVKAYAEKSKQLKVNLFNLIDNTYQTYLNEPHVGIKSVSDVFSSRYDWWVAIDLDDKPDADAVIFGKKLYGLKISGIGHDGEKLSKSVLVMQLVDFLRDDGYWIEASGDVARVLLTADIPIVKDVDKISKITDTKKIIETFDDGSYIRETSTGYVTGREYIFGNPKI